ncbi:MAG TPA: YlxR family protein [Bacillota bacterium]|nr:YlxR family protein [Bacillota bacterium]
MAKKRKTPLRKCVVTQEMHPKDSLIRIVRTKDGEVFVDPTGKKNGRGAYISKSVEVIEKARNSHILATHLHVHIDPSLYDDMLELVKGNQS